MSDEEVLYVHIDEDEKKDFKKRVDNMSESVQALVEQFNEVNETEEIADDMNEMNQVVIRTYLSAIRKNITLLKQQEDKLESLLEEYEEDEKEPVLEINVNIDGKGPN